MEPAKGIQFRIVKCEELSFETKLSTLINIDSESLSFKFGFKIERVGSEALSIVISAMYYSGEARVLRHESSTTFEISNIEDAFDFSDEGRVDDKVGLMPTLFSISYSTMRGMLAIRTAGTVLDSFPAPIVNPTEVLKNAKA